MKTNIKSATRKQIRCNRVCKRVQKSLICILATFSLVPAFGSWVKSSINDSYYYANVGITALQIGAGRNDGVNRLYAATSGNSGPWEGNLTEFSYTSGAWNSVSLDDGSYGAGEILYFNSIAVGAGRYDTVARVYAATSVGIREYTLSAGQWSINTFGDASSPFLTLADLENSGIPKVYDLINNSGHVYLDEWSYSFGSFAGIGLTSFAASIIGGTMGAGRNDGIQRFYGVGSSGNLLEFSLASGVWSSNNVTVIPAILKSVAVGAGRNDGVQRLYVACQDSHIYELTYNSGTWSLVNVGYGGQSMNCVAVGAGHNDGQMHVYGGNSDGHMYEFTYAANAWTTTDLGSGNGTMECITIGNGRNDGVVRVYAGNTDFNIYEFTYSPTATNLPPAVTLSQNGYLTWSNTQIGAVCDVQWLPNLQSTNWSGDWSSLSGILVTNSVMTVKVPMFYRVKVRTSN
jgi:hypothetical protein